MFIREQLIRSLYDLQPKFYDEELLDIYINSPKTCRWQTGLLPRATTPAQSCLTASTATCSPFTATSRCSASTQVAKTESRS